MVLRDSKLLQHASRIYTIGAYMLFERQFIRFPEFRQELVVSNHGEHLYEIWRLDISAFKHLVVYNEHTFSILCTCKMFSEVSILCSHCLRVLNKHCVQAIIDKYILERWTKNIGLSWESTGVGDAETVNKGNAASSVWRMEMLRKIVAEVGLYHVDNLENEGLSIIKDSIGSRAKGELNVRERSIVEIRCNQVKGKRKNALIFASRNNTVVQLSINNAALGKDVNAPSSECLFSLGISSYSDVEPSSTLQPLLTFL
ncbi:hypothetical protein M9H77_31845 [Catharanthus roseus]|uniref:Uncharacterized protein n=1 Tax=Catharanthus roseus TaxID=4058 RepID=A0ACC0A1A9_CATRO|nr:hypothetical protein M9H77_31845 [Catharanthus roseus]